MSIDIKKALGVSEIGSVIMQPEIDKEIAHIVEYKNPLRQNLPRKKGSGRYWYVNRRVAGSTPAEFVSDTDSATEDTSTYSQVTFEYKTILTKGKVSRKARAIGRSLLDILAEEIEAKAKDFRDFEEYALFRGDSSSNSKEFDGLDVLIPSSQTVLMTTASGGAPLTLEKVDELIDKCAGEPDMLIMSKRTRRQLVTLLQASQRWVNQVEVKGGFKLVSYNGIPCYVSTRIVDTMQFDGSEVTGYTGGTCSTMYAIDTDETFIAELTPLQIMPLARTTSQYEEFEIFCDEVLVVKNYMANAKLIGIAPSE